MRRASCETCAFAAREGSLGAPLECRANPPQLVQLRENVWKSAFPTVRETDWCGGWRRPGR